jgi:hypothetical protein
LGGCSIEDMQVLNKYDKEELVLKMHQEGKTMREIASAAHMSFGDIGKIIRGIDGQKNNHSDDTDLSNKSKSKLNSLYVIDRRDETVSLNQFGGVSKTLNEP